jgi:hypothetical protein
MAMPTSANVAPATANLQPPIRNYMSATTCPCPYLHAHLSFHVRVHIHIRVRGCVHVNVHIHGHVHIHFRVQGSFVILPCYLR